MVGKIMKPVIFQERDKWVKKKEFEDVLEEVEEDILEVGVEETKDFVDMNIKELKAFCKAEEIDIKGLTKKQELIDAIYEQFEE